MLLRNVGSRLPAARYLPVCDSCLPCGALVGIWPVYFLLMFNFRFVQGHQAVGKVTADQNCNCITR